MPSIQMRSARSAHADEEAAAEELVSQLGAFRPKLVTLFASRGRDHTRLNRAVRSRFPKGTRLIGASTAGEIDNEGSHSGSVVLSGLAGDFDVGIGLAEKISGDAARVAGLATARAFDELGLHARDANPKRCVGIVIDDGFRYRKEELLMGILEKNQSLVLVGGGASDHERDPAKQSALIHVDGEVVTDGALVAFVRTEAPWAALRSHWFEPTGQKLRITRVDESALFALEIDGRPAAKRYAELLGVELADLDFMGSKGFSVRPTALKVGREYFIRGPWYPTPEGTIRFANLLDEGAEYEVMKRGDMVKMTQQFFDEVVPSRVQSPQAALLFNCSARAMLVRANGLDEGMNAAYAHAPTCAGFNVNFEIYCGFAINSTLTSVVFGAS